ncbi:MAG: tetratricopeptide repeat-containing sulfotransferase family protein [Novosphingobium sp.]
MTSSPAPELKPILEHMRERNFTAALSAADAALRSCPNDPALLELAAIAALQAGQIERAVTWLERQLAIAPDNRAARFNLASALATLGRSDAALDLAAEYAGQPKLARLAGYLLQQKGRNDEAIPAYRAALNEVPGDWETWNNLGNCLSAAGESDAAVAAIEQAINAAPGNGTPELFLNLLRALGLTGNEQPRLHAAEEATRRFPDHPDLRFELGVAQFAAGQLDEAEATLKRAADAEASFGRAAMELGMLYETTNRLDELDAHVARCAERGPSPELAFLQAWSLRRRNRFAEAAEYAARIPPTINPARTAQLRAEIADRLGDEAEAFRQYELMNRASVDSDPLPPGPTYREQVAAQTAAMGPPLPARQAKPGEPSDPVFIVGSPRSGTTLLDTLLRALPELQVIEEMPMLAMVVEEFPGLERQSDLTQVDAARARYFELAEQLESPAGGRRIVDKMPLHLTHMPVIHRLFPDAAIILVERHPCDAVLSCFITNLALSHAMHSYTTLEGSARTYDAIFANWMRANELLPLRVHRVRYERMIADLEAELRPLVAFLGLPWRDEVLDNQASAARRGMVRTASYAQVGQPLYTRAVARWERYRKQMVPVLQIITPWIERLGYAPPEAGS